MTDQELRKRIERVVRGWARPPVKTFEELVDALVRVAKEAQDSAAPTEMSNVNGDND